MVGTTRLDKENEQVYPSEFKKEEEALV